MTAFYLCLSKMMITDIRNKSHHIYKGIFLKVHLHTREVRTLFTMTIQLLYCEDKAFDNTLLPPQVSWFMCSNPVTTQWTLDISISSYPPLQSAIRPSLKITRYQPGF